MKSIDCKRVKLFYCEKCRVEFIHKLNFDYHNQLNHTNKINFCYLFNICKKNQL